MIKRVMHILAFSILVTEMSIAQLGSALSYFPLNIGDMWQYHYHYDSGPPIGSVSKYFVKSVTADSLLPNGRWYKKVVSTGPGTPGAVYLRVDSLTSSVYRYTLSAGPSNEEKVDSLAASVGDTVSDNGWPVVSCINSGTTTVLGTTTPAKDFLTMILPQSTYTLAYGLGLVARIDPGEGPAWLYPIYTDLVYARINGIEFGHLVSVLREDESQPQTFVLKPNYPNPFNGSTTIAFSLSRRGEVSIEFYNVLGERVSTIMAAHLGPGDQQVRWTPDNLPTGIYICRLRSEERVSNLKMTYVK